MKEEKSKVDVVLGTIGISAATIVAAGIIIKIVTANWSFFTKLIVLAAIILFIILSYYKVKDEKEARKGVSEPDKQAPRNTKAVSRSR